MKQCINLYLIRAYGDLGLEAQACLICFNFDELMLEAFHFSWLANGKLEVKKILKYFKRGAQF